jgi:hypothetical protein
MVKAIRGVCRVLTRPRPGTADASRHARQVRRIDQGHAGRH